MDCCCSHNFECLTSKIEKKKSYRYLCTKLNKYLFIIYLKLKINKLFINSFLLILTYLYIKFYVCQLSVHE